MDTSDPGLLDEVQETGDPDKVVMWTHKHCSNCPGPKPGCWECEGLGYFLVAYYYEGERAEALREAEVLRRLRIKQLRDRGCKCDICGEAVKFEERYGPHIDVDPRTKQARGFLCGGCKKGLAGFKEEPVLMMKAMTYLKKWTGILGGSNHHRQEQVTCESNIGATTARSSTT